jgi:phosphate transport system protein
MPVSRQSFHEDLKALEQDLIQMASLAERNLTGAVESLSRLDVELARQVIASDDEVDNLDHEIEQHCLRILALQQPMAKDLRTVGTVMKAITDIERIGDLAVDIAKITLKVNAILGDAKAIDLLRLAVPVRRMLRDSIEAFVKRDLDTVSQVILADDEVDAIFRELRGQLHEIMQSQPERVVEASWLLQAIIHLERVADHATNIAERVYFMETGKVEDLIGKLKSQSS